MNEVIKSGLYMTQRSDTGHFPPAHDLACVPTSLIPTPGCQHMTWHVYPLTSFPHQGARMELTMSVHHTISEEE